MVLYVILCEQLVCIVIRHNSTYSKKRKSNASSTIFQSFCTNYMGPLTLEITTLIHLRYEIVTDQPSPAPQPIRLQYLSLIISWSVVDQGAEFRQCVTVYYYRVETELVTSV